MPPSLPDARQQLQSLLRQRLEVTPPTSATSEMATGENCVVVRPAGNTAPLVCIAGGGAGVPSYRRLSALLPDVPMYVTQLYGAANRGTTYASIPAMAAAHREILREHLPQGPFFLCGHSLGGTIAFELAQQLIAVGAQVQGLFIIDQTGPDVRLSVHHWLYWQWVAISHLSWRMRYAYVLDGIRFRLRTTRWLPQGLRVGLFSKRPQAGQPRTATRVSTHEYRRQMAEMSIQALRAYRPSPCSIPMTLLRARSGAPRIHVDPQGGWGRIATGGIQVFDLPGTHMQLFQEPTLRDLAEILGRVVRGCGRV